jgi:RNA polymerase sigma factor (sigma-70 family)
MHESSSDEQLIADYLEGEEKALGALVDRYLGDVYTFAVKLTRDTQAAEDITQESFTKAWKNMRKFVPGNSFRGWLFSIVRNTAIDFLRKKKEVAFSTFETTPEGENVFVESLADTGPLQDELLARAEDARYIETLLAQINPEYREVLALRHASDMTFGEIGKSLKRPLHTVKSQYRRGLAAVRRLLEAKTA